MISLHISVYANRKTNLALVLSNLFCYDLATVNTLVLK